MTAAVSAGAGLRELFVTPEAAEREPELLAAADRLGAPVRWVSDRVLGRLSETVTPQGIVAVVATPAADLETVATARPRLVVLLDAVADPGNAGTVIRTADAAGADAVVLGAGSADPTSGKAVRASAGSLFHLPVVAGVPAVAAAERLRSAGLQLLATAADGDSDLDALLDAGDLGRPTCWLLGNEADGLPAELLSVSDRRVRINMRGQAESLNLAAAAAVCLFASARGHRG